VKSSDVCVYVACIRLDLVSYSFKEDVELKLIMRSETLVCHNCGGLSVYLLFLISVTSNYTIVVIVYSDSITTGLLLCH